MTFKLQCIEGPLRGKDFTLPKEEVITMGRHEENHLVFDSPKVSRKHAELIQQGSHLFLKDLGSQNGVYLNGHRIEQSSLEIAVEIQVGDEVSFGDYIFKIDFIQGIQKDHNERMTSPTFGPKRFSKPSLGDNPIPIRESDIKSKTHIAILYGAFRSLARSSNQKDFYEALSLVIIKILKAERVCLMDFDPKKKTLSPKFFANLSFLGKKARFEPSMMVLHEVMNKKETIYTIDAGKDDRFKEGASITDVGVRSIICAPLLEQENLVGAIYVDTLQSQNSFGSDEKKHLEALGNLLVTAKDHF